MTWSRALWWSIAGHLCLLLAALRHRFFWGGNKWLFDIELSTWLNFGESAALILFVALAGIAYLRAIQLAKEVSPRQIMTAAGILCAIACLAPPMLSTDVFDYVARGRVEASFGQNPYLVPPANFPGDKAVMLCEWPDFIMPYGPVSAVIQALFAFPSNPWVGVYLFKIFFGLCHLLTAVTIYLALKPRGEQTARVALCAFAWNPWLLLESAGSAHNEALMALSIGGMGLMITRSRWTLATVCFGLAMLTKHGIAPLGPLLLILAWREGKLRDFAQGVMLTAALTAVAAWHYQWFDAGGLDFLSKQVGNRGTSLQHFLTIATDQSWIPTVAGLGYLLALVLLIRAGMRTGNSQSFGREGSLLTLAFLLVAMPLFSPWYHLWWLPLMGVAGLKITLPALRCLAFCGPLSYLVFTSTRSFGLDHQLWQWSLALVLPLVVITRALRRCNDADL